MQTFFELLYNEFQSEGFQDYQQVLFECILQTTRKIAPQLFVADTHPLRNVILQIQRRFQKYPADETSLEELASEYNFSISYLTHKFKQITGYSIGEYRMLCRIEAAKKMLLTTENSIGTISNRCGFADMSNFCRYFRKIVGCSPSTFRNCSVDYD